MAVSFATPSRSVSSSLYFCFWTLFCWGRLKRDQLILENIPNPFALEKGGAPDGFPSVSFVVDMAQCREGCIPVQ